MPLRPLFSVPEVTLRLIFAEAGQASDALQHAVGGQRFVAQGGAHFADRRGQAGRSDALDIHRPAGDAHRAVDAFVFNGPSAIARAISWALRTRTTWTSAGGAIFVGPLTSTTRAPRRDASAAIA